MHCPSTLDVHSPSAGPGHPVRDWVEAEPFRAHLHHLAETTGVPWQLLALHAGISLALADHLMNGRRGRHVRRLSKASASHIIAVSAQDAATLGTVWVRATLARRRANALIRLGWPRATLAPALGIAPAELDSLLAGRTEWVTRLLDLQAAWLVSDNELVRPRAVA